MPRMLSLGLPLAVVACGTSAPAPVAKGAFKLEDVVHTTDDALRIEVRRREVPLETMPIAPLLGGIPMSGLADVAIDLTIPRSGDTHLYREARGSAAFSCAAGCTIGEDGGKLPFRKLSLGRVDIRAVAKDGKLELRQALVDSKDLTLRATLTITFADKLDDSTLDGCVRFKPDPSLEQRDPRTHAVIATTGAPLGPDGFYSIKIGGRLGERRLLGELCGAPGTHASAT